MHGNRARHRIRTTFVRSLRAQALVVVLLPVVVVLGNLGAATWFDHVNHRARLQVEAAQHVLVGATSAQATLLGAEADAGSYIIDGRAADRSAFDAAARAVSAQVSRLVRSSGRRSPLHADLVRATGDMAQLSQVLATMVAKPGSPSTVVDVTAVASFDARMTAAMSAVRHQVARLVADDQIAISASSTDLVIVGAIVAGATVLGGIGITLLFAGRGVRRLRQLEEATAALAAGHPPGPLPGGGDEVGRLGRQMAETAARIRQHEDAREQARANLDAIMAASPLVSLRYDIARHAVVYASPNIESTFGLRAQEVMADTGALARRLHPDDLQGLAGHIRDAIASMPPGPASEHHIRFRRSDADDWGEAQVVITTIGDTAGSEGRSVVAYVVDVTERLRTERAADERRHLLESIFDASPDIIVVRDGSDEVVLASGQVNELVGTQLGIGPSPPQATAHDRLTERNRQDLADLIRRCRQGDSNAAPLVITATAGDGVVRVLETRARPVVADDGRVTGTVTISRDITDRVELEESLRQASRSAEAASTAKSEFLSRMSHELRTPLNAVLGFAQLLELDDLAPEHADFVDQIRRAGQHLLSLINEVLDIARIESGHLSVSVEPVPVDEVMAEVAALLTPVAEASRIQMQLVTEATAGTHVLGDRQRLLQVLLNLGSNAVKYNHPDGLVVLHTNLEADGWVRFSVADTGPGIAPERRTELFVPFSRLGAERSAVEGTGVGLALSKNLVELMGGSIGVTSDPGRGSTFWVELRQADAPAAVGGSLAPGDPRAASRTPDWEAGVGPVAVSAGRLQARQDSSSAAADGAEMPLVVLHVEDNESNAALVAQVLARRREVQLLYASRARIGLELAARHRPDLILLDLHLPDLPGDEFLHRLRADPDIAGTRVVAVSADATAARIRRMLGLGVEAYLTKPIDVPSLLRLVDLVRAGRPVPEQGPVPLAAPDRPQRHQGPGQSTEAPGAMP